MPYISNQDAYRFLREQKELIEREYQYHLRTHGHDAETCILKANHRDISRKLDAVMEGNINE